MMITKCKCESGKPVRRETTKHPGYMIIRKVCTGCRHESMSKIDLETGELYVVKE